MRVQLHLTLIRFPLSSVVRFHLVVRRPSLVRRFRRSVRRFVAHPPTATVGADFVGTSDRSYRSQGRHAAGRSHRSRIVSNRYHHVVDVRHASMSPRMGDGMLPPVRAALHFALGIAHRRRLS